MPKTQYVVTLAHGADIYKGKGDNIVAALDEILLNGYVKVKAILTVTYGTLKAETYLYPPMLKKLLINKTSKELFQKRMLGALK